MRNTKSNSRITRLVRGVLLGGASTLVLGAAATSAYAQDATATAPTTATPAASDNAIVVTGIRGSLQKSLNVKKNSVGVVDAISAEDIGKFPDSNLAAAIQRIPGVSVSRGDSSINGGNDSQGDATEITVRGFGPGFNQTLYDGREVSTATGNRGFDFSSVGSDFVGEIDVLKTPDATLSSGAIGATINIKYPKPFDHTGLKLAGSVSATDAPKDGNATPNFGLLFSDTFGSNDNFGVLADLAFSQHETQANHAYSAGWEGTQLSPSQLAGAAPGASTTPNTNAWFIQDYGFGQEQTKDTREDGRLVLQWRPMGNLTLTANDDYSRDDVRQTTHDVSFWFNGGSLSNVSLAPNGTVINFTQNNSPTDLDSGINASLLENNEVGFNANWDVNSNFNVVFDVDDAQSWLNPDHRPNGVGGDIGYGPSTPGGTNGVNIGVAGIGPNSIPYLTAYGPNGNTGAFADPGAIIGSHVLTISAQSNHDTVNQVKLAGTWTQDHLKVQFGVHYVDDKIQLTESDDFGNNDWQAYAGYGPSSNNNGTHGVALPASLITGTFSTSNFINGFSGSGNLPANVPQYNVVTLLHYLQSLGNPQVTPIVGQNTGCCTPAFNGIYSVVPSAGSFQTVDEGTVAAFLSVTQDEELAGMPLKVNVGVRAEQTTSRSIGESNQPTALTVQPSDHTAYLVTFGPTTLITDDNTYRYLLPNLDLNLGVTDQIKLRFDASRTLTRAPISDLTPDTNLGAERVGSLTATGGNPNLLPYLSDNLDLGAEWYYSPNSYLSVDGFMKEVSNFVVGGTVAKPINGVTLPGTNTLAQFSVTSQVNGPSAEVSGVELAWQHVFWDTGFGFQSNATFVSTNKPYDPNNLTTSGFAVTGLANSANLVAFYDKHGFQARVAVNWRGSYLDHFGQSQNNSLFGIEPTFVDSSTQVDFSSSYDVNRHLSIFVEGLNLTDAVYATHGRFSNQLLDLVDYGSRFTIGAHFRY